MADLDIALEAVTEGRALAEELMLDTCVITDDGGQPTFDPDTGQYTTPVGATIYDGACQVQVSNGLNAQTSDVGGEVITEQRVTVKIPTSVEGVTTGQVVTITASVMDPDLPGKRYRILGGFAKSLATSRRLQVEEIST